MTRERLGELGDRGKILLRQISTLTVERSLNISEVVFITGIDLKKLRGAGVATKRPLEPLSEERKKSLMPLQESWRRGEINALGVNQRNGATGKAQK